MGSNMREGKGDLYGPPYDDKDEISLFDLWLILARRRKAFWITFSLVMIASLAIIFLLPPVYRSRAVIQVGRVKDVPIESPSSLVVRLKEKYGLGDRKLLPRHLPHLEKVEMDKGTMRGPENGIIVFYARGRTPEQARAFLQRVTERLIQKNMVLFKEVIQLRREQLARLEKELVSLNKQETLIIGDAAKYTNNIWDTAFPMRLERVRLQVQIADLDLQRANLEMNLSKAYTWETRYILKPMLVKRAVRPRPALYFVLGTILALFLGIFFAFTAEFFANSSQKVKEIRQQTDGASGKKDIQ